MHSLAQNSPYNMYGSIEPYTEYRRGIRCFLRTSTSAVLLATNARKCAQLRLMIGREAKLVLETALLNSAQRTEEHTRTRAL